MTLTISDPLSESRAHSPHGPLVDEVAVELSSWNPREFIVAFRRWHQGSLSLIHLNVLTLLEAEGPLSMSRLAEDLDVSVASMTGIADRMVKRGFVERLRDEHDRRLVLISPTAEGARVFQDIDQRRREGLTAILGHLTDGELAALLTGHRALRAARASVASTRDAGPTQPARAGTAPLPNPTRETPR